MSSVTRAAAADRPNVSPAEVFADGTVHALGMIGATIAAVTLVRGAAAGGDAAMLVATLVYGAALVAMPVVSGAYNLGAFPRRRAFLRQLDQATIFVLIAGTYTPFGLIALGGVIGHTLLVLVWTVALIGAALKLRWPDALSTRRSVALYLALGWCALPAIGPLVAALAGATLAWLGLGGVLYSVGVIFHLWTTLPFHNAIWHMFVVAAAACHVVAVFDVVTG
jgi:hemolysin III